MPHIHQPAATPQNGTPKPKSAPGVLYLTARFLIACVVWLLLFVAVVAALHWVLSLALLSYICPVSHEGFTQCDQVELRTPIPATHIESGAPLNAPVDKGQFVCRATNHLVERTELRSLTQEISRLRASSECVVAQRNSVGRRLYTVSVEIEVFLEQTARSISARIDQAQAAIDAARAESEIAGRSVSRLTSLGGNVADADRDQARAHLAVVNSRVRSGEAELGRLRAEQKALDQGISLDHIELIDRKSLLVQRHDELEAELRRLESELTGAEERLASARIEVETKSETILTSTISGRTVWVNPANTIHANEPVVRIARPVELIETLFSKGVANRIYPEQRAVISLATGLYLTGHVVMLDESSPQSGRQSRLIDVPRRPDQVRVIIALDPLPDMQAPQAGIPAHVALTGRSEVCCLISPSWSLWCRASGLIALVLWLILRAALVHFLPAPKDAAPVAGASGAPLGGRGKSKQRQESKSRLDK